MFSSKFSTVSLTALLLAAGPVFSARAAEAVTQPADAIDEVVVIANDNTGLLERLPSSTVTGVDKPLIETPRSASFASELTMQRYGIETVDDLVAVSPGAFTASFYNVPGSVALRGTLAEVYFRGFKRVENRGNYPTPLGGAEQVEIVRGPPTPFTGPGKVGGFLNFVPRTAKIEGRYITEPTGMAQVTFGSYGKKNAAAQVGLPANFGEVQGGIYAYGEIEDSKSFYRGITPEHQLLQVSSDFSTPSGFFLAFGGMYYNSDGYVQTPGWNRLTQDLVDNRNYIRGRDTTIVDRDGNGRLTPNEIGASLTRGYTPGVVPAIDQRFTLDTGLGVSKIDRRTVFVSDRDFAEAQTQTYFFDVGKRLNDKHDIKFQGFYDSLKTDRFVSYGFPASYDTWVAEARITYNGEFATSDRMIVAKTVTGLSWRTFEGQRKESTSFIGPDRRDIITGPTPNDIFDDPFSIEPGGIGLPWNLHNVSKWHDRGLFGMADIMIGGRLNLVLGGRLDDYNVKSQDIGTAASAANRRGQKDARGKGAYTVSASYKLPAGLMPYVTYAEGAALEVSQAGDVNPGQVGNRSWLSDSDLREAGVKGQWLGGSLLGSLSVYRQTRTALNSISMTVVGHRSKGVELEARWVANKNWSVSFNGNSQKTIVKGPDNGFVYIPPSVALTSGANGYGGGYAVFAYSSFAERRVDYEFTPIPRNVVTLFTSYTSDEFSWGQAGGVVGMRYVTKTSGTVPGAVVYPEYAAFNASAYVQHGPWMATLNVDNLFNKLYFTPVADVYANIAVLPSKGREWRITVQRKF